MRLPPPYALPPHPPFLFLPPACNKSSAAAVEGEEEQLGEVQLSFRAAWVGGWVGG